MNKYVIAFLGFLCGGAYVSCWWVGGVFSGGAWALPLCVTVMGLSGIAAWATEKEAGR